MHSIEVDFEVLKALMALRPSESVTNNDVIRDLLKLAKLQPAAQIRSSESNPLAGRDLITKGVRIPAGTEFRGKHDGEIVMGRIENGQLVVNGEPHNSLSSAAYHITKYSVNGWKFWECRAPGGEWRPAASLRSARRWI